MGIIDKVLKAAGYVRDKPPTRILTGSNMSLPMPNWSNFNDAKNIERYLTLDDVYSIVRKISKTAAMIPLRVYEVQDDKALKEYEYASKQHNHSVAALIKKQFLKVKALVEVKDDNPLQMLLDCPNRLYQKQEFYEGVYGFRLLTGNSYTWVPKYDYGLDKGKPMEMWILPPQHTNPIVKQTFPHTVDEYLFVLYAQAKIPADEILHSRYFNPYFTINGDELVGLSPLRALHRTLDVGDSQSRFMRSGFENAGAVGIVNFEGLEESEAAKLGQMKTDFYGDSSGTRNARKSLFHNGKTSFTEMGLSPVDMEVIDSMKITFKKYCNAYGISDRLFNNDATGSEISVTLMVKELFTNAALPEVFAHRDLLNAKVTPLYNVGNKRYFVDADITAITELQEDMKKMAEIYGALPVMQPNMILEAFNYGRSDDPLMDKYYIKSGYQPIDDMNITDLPLTGDYADNQAN